MFIIRYSIAICLRVYTVECLRSGTARNPHRSARSGV